MADQELGVGRQDVILVLAQLRPNLSDQDLVQVMSLC
jgi:hypothetical protein